MKLVGPHPPTTSLSGILAAAGSPAATPIPGSCVPDHSSHEQALAYVQVYLGFTRTVCSITLKFYHNEYMNVCIYPKHGVHSNSEGQSDTIRAKKKDVRPSQF